MTSLPRTTIPFPEPTSKILPRTIHELGPAFEHIFYCNNVIYHWPDIVGPAIAQNVEAVRILRETLWLYTYDSSWRNQIAYMQTQIIERVNQYACRMLIKELRFARSGKERVRLAAKPADEGVDYAKALPKINLSDEEVDDIRARCAHVENDDLRASLFRITLKQAKLDRLRLALGYHKCADCNSLCEPGRKRCSSCALKHDEAVRSAIHHYLVDCPWARYGEVRREIPEATPELLYSVRAGYIREIEANVLLEHPETLAAKTLTMAYRCLPPEQLTDDIVRHTLWHLRSELAKPAVWRPIRRYEYLGLGKKK